MLRKTILIIFTIIMPGLLLLTACSDDTGSPDQQIRQLLAINADIYRFEIDLVADGKEWLVSHARWQRARLEDFGL